MKEGKTNFSLGEGHMNSGPRGISISEIQQDIKQNSETAHTKSLETIHHTLDNRSPNQKCTAYSIEYCVYCNRQ